MPIDIKRASRETLEMYATASEAIEDNPDHPGHLKAFTFIQQRLHRECATPTLRTRAERDSELHDFMVNNFDRADIDSTFNPPTATAIWKLMTEQCSEPVAEPPADECPSCQSQDKDLRLVEAHVPCADRWHDPCGCPASDELRARVKELERQASSAIRELEQERSARRNERNALKSDLDEMFAKCLDRVDES